MEMRSDAGLGVCLFVVSLLSQGCSRSGANRSSSASVASEAVGSIRWALAERPATLRIDSRLPRKRNGLRQDSSHWRGKVVYDEVYRGIALTLEPLRHGFEYRFDVAPGSDPGWIRMRYDGAEEISVEDDGRRLRVCGAGRVLRERGLHCWQEGPTLRRDVACSYHVGRAVDGAFEVSFDVGSYDGTGMVVIDPEIEWSSYLGGSDYDDTYYSNIAVDRSGDVYLTGYTFSTDFPSIGGFDTSFGGA
jgi:beta-propeller repeat-containing protein